MDALFLFKRLIGHLAQPAVVGLLLLALSLFFHFRKGWLGRRLATVFLVATFLFFVVVLFPYPVRAVAYWLESPHRPILTNDGSLRPYAIVIHGNGVEHPNDPNLPALSRLNHNGRARVVEAVRLALLFPEARLITTGYGIYDEDAAAVMADAVIELGVDPSRIERFGHTLDTREEAEDSARLAAGRQLLVVTSAAHMERAMRYYRDVGADAVAAPCDYIAPLDEVSYYLVNRTRWYPRGRAMSANEQVWHEILGLIYQGLLEKKDGGE